MNDKPKFPRAVALEAARDICAKLKPCCETDRLKVCGSLRRGKAEVGDVEIVYVPKIEIVPDGLFDTAAVNMPDAVLARLDRRTTQARGVADFIIFADGGRVFAVECKRPGAKPRPEQLAFAAVCKTLGHRHFFCYSYTAFLTFIESNT